MSNTEFLMVGLLFSILGHVTDNEIFSVLFFVLAIVYIGISMFRKEKKL